MTEPQPELPELNFFDDLEKQLAVELESLVYRPNGTTYIDAVCHYCETRGYEIEAVATIIAKNLNLRLAIQKEGEQLRFLKKIVRLAI